jgi:hypothetical protein
MEVCAAEWKRSHARRVPEEQVMRVMEIAATGSAAKEPVSSYREIAQVVNQRRRR